MRILLIDRTDNVPSRLVARKIIEAIRLHMKEEGENPKLLLEKSDDIENIRNQMI
jgi:hypothetical protein